MSITDELRTGGIYRFPSNRRVFTEEELTAIADRIDAEHDREMIDIRTRGWSNGYDEGFASADDWLAQHEDAMAEHGWVRLPVDADGVPIHVGDVMEWPDTSTAEVVGIGNDTFFYVEDGEDAAEWSCANDKTHHHAPTVEDVLMEFAAKIIERGELTNGAAQTIAEYAAKLRLAGDGE